MASQPEEEFTLSTVSPYVILSVVCDSMIYIPVLDDYAIGLVSGAMIRRIALMRGVLLSEESVKYLALGELTKSQGALEALVRSFTSPWAYLKGKLEILSAGEEAAKSLGLGVLFHHYATRHKRKAIKLAEARKLKWFIETAVKKASVKFPMSLIKSIKTVSPELFRDLSRTMGKEARRMRKSRQEAGTPYFDRVNLLVGASTGPFVEASHRIGRLLEKEAAEFCAFAISLFDRMVAKSPPWVTGKPTAKSPAPPAAERLPGTGDTPAAPPEGARADAPPQAGRQGNLAAREAKGPKSPGKRNRRQKAAGKSQENAVYEK